MSDDRFYQTARAGILDPEMLRDADHCVPYKVRNGDSLKSIAEALDCTWQELAILNWGTDDPQRINWYLRTTFVCKNNEGGNYVFSNDDDPGILLLPRPYDRQRRRIRKAVIGASRFLER
jgi:LysM domain-containing protein